MAQMLLSRVKKLVKIISSLLLFWTISWIGHAQTILLSGDLIIVSANGSNSTIELVSLVDLEVGTSFTLKVESSANSEITIFLNQEIAAGNSIFVTKEYGDQITIVGELNLNADSDQVSVFQKKDEFNRVLFIASWGNENGDFDKKPISSVPNIRLGNGSNHQYHLKNGASGTTGMILRMISDPANWKSSDKPYNRLRTSFRILPAPVIVFNQNVSTVMEGDSIPLNVAIYEHDGSRLTVDVVLNDAFSTADTNDVNQFRSYTYNFTGLIGDAVYETAIPLTDDAFFEDQETAFFELQNLSAGNFGDFVSHATFIVDNEIPDVSVSSAHNSDVPDANYIILQNNERVYVNIAEWKLYAGEGFYELKSIVDLAPFERRVISAIEILQSVSDSERGFEIESEKLVLVDGFGNTISEFKKELDLGIDTEINVNENSELSMEFELPQTVAQEIGLDISVKTEQESIGQERQEGWYPVNALDFSESVTQVFWDEQLSKFRTTSTVDVDSLAGLSLLQYFSPDFEEDRQSQIFVDSLSVSEVFESDVEWSITLSATDSDQNGFINEAEGYNFIQFNGSDSITVENFITQIEELIGENFIYQIIFRLDDVGLHPATGIEYLHKGEFLWIKADSVFERTELILKPDLVATTQETSDDYDEPISNFRLNVKAEAEATNLVFNFFDIDAQIPLSVVNPYLDLRFKLTQDSLTRIGAFTGRNWKSVVNIGYQQETLIAFPLGITNHKSAEISIQLEEWNMEGGWRLFIEDNETKERTELYPGEEFSMEFVIESVSDVSDANEELAVVRSELNERFNLLLASPHYDESILDSPERIELNQNYPNPFNPATTISFFVPEAVEIKLSIFNVVGQPIAVLEEGILSAGEHHYEWNASGYPSGMYIYQLEVGNKVMTRKMTLVK